MRLLAASLLALTASALGQAPAPPAPAAHSHSLSLAAESTAAGGTAVHPGATSFKRALNVTETTVAEAVKITVHNFGAAPDSARVEYYFIGAPAAAPGASIPPQEYVVGQGAKDLSLAAGGTEILSAQSPEIGSRIRRPKKGKPTASGSVFRGWLVRLLADGRVLAVRGSKQAYEDLAKDDARLNALKSGAAPAR